MGASVILKNAYGLADEPHLDLWHLRNATARIGLILEVLFRFLRGRRYNPRIFRLLSKKLHRRCPLLLVPSLPHARTIFARALLPTDFWQFLVIELAPIFARLATHGPPADRFGSGPRLVFERSRINGGHDKRLRFQIQELRVRRVARSCGEH